MSRRLNRTGIAVAALALATLAIAASDARSLYAEYAMRQHPPVVGPPS